MILNESLTFYDILDLSPNASPQEVREGYIRAKSTFNRDSLALYTIMSHEEREETLKKIEEAYHVLSNSEKRRQYDECYGFVALHEDPFTPKKEEFSLTAEPFYSPAQAQGGKVISIDRVPPMEALLNSEQILIPPKTDFAQTNIPTSAPRAETRSPMPTLTPALQEAIDMETEWSGPFLKKVREAYKISLEEMAGITKVTKTYIKAIEDEKYDKLPAAVYIRGFTMQIARVLKIPHEKVAKAYVSRYQRNRKAD